MAQPGGQVRKSIFVSYRREDDGWALTITTALRERFGEKRVFQDVDGIDAGSDFVDRIEEALDESGAVVALVGRNWLQAGADGTGGVHDPADWVRIEIETALRKGVAVIPVRLGDAEMPRVRDLPDALRKFGRLEAKRVSRDYWEQDIKVLSKRLESFVGKASPRRSPSRSTRDAGARPASTPTASSPAPAPSTTGTPAPAKTFPAPAVGAAPAFSSFGAAGMSAGAEAFERWRNSPEAQAMRERAAARDAAKAEARRGSVPFFGQPLWWLSVPLTVVACVALANGVEGPFTSGLGLLGVELSSRTPGLPMTLLGLAWAAVYLYRGTSAYRDDPRRGAFAFFTWGLFGGWRLLGRDEPRAWFTGAFPLSIAVAWIVTRVAGDVLATALNASFYPIALLPLLLFSIWTILHYNEVATWAEQG